MQHLCYFLTVLELCRRARALLPPEASCVPRPKVRDAQASTHVHRLCWQSVNFMALLLKKADPWPLMQNTSYYRRCRPSQ